MTNEKRQIVLDYETVREAFDEEFKETMQLIKNGETHLDNLAEGFTEADRVLLRMFFDSKNEIMRCKDCKWSEQLGDEIVICHNFRNGLYSDARVDDFCSYGEKRDMCGTQPQREDV